jgi:hypothetical protein
MVFAFALEQKSTPNRKYFIFFRYRFLIVGICNPPAVYR